MIFFGVGLRKCGYGYIRIISSSYEIKAEPAMRFTPLTEIFLSTVLC